MGCDIHLAVERRTATGDLWERAEKWVENPYLKWSTPEEPEPEQVRERWYRGRNYALFGILAGVRSDAFPAIDDERDLPDDVCDEVRAESDRWDLDGHSHSFLTLSELLDYDWGDTAPDYTGEPITAWAAVTGYGVAFPRLLLRMRLEALEQGLSNDDVRIVFWFDN